jgi:hypothetical protein
VWLACCTADTQAATVKRDKTKGVEKYLLDAAHRGLWSLLPVVTGMLAADDGRSVANIIKLETKEKIKFSK